MTRGLKEESSENKNDCTKIMIKNKDKRKTNIRSILMQNVRVSKQETNKD